MLLLKILLKAYFKLPMTLLHEIQHFVQKTESGLSGKGFVADYAAKNKATVDRIGNLENKVGRPPIEYPPKSYYIYKMNPYEREAFEASRRDVDPQYRNEFSRKLEEHVKKK